MIFFLWGHLGGGAPRICGGHVPPPPQAPVATPLREREREGVGGRRKREGERGGRVTEVE